MKVCPGCRREYRPSSKAQTFCSVQCRATASVGNRTKTGDGYYRVMVPQGTPGADGSGRMLEHRWVMQQFLDRPLRETETVHHRNGRRDHNVITNLELRTNLHPPGQTVEEMLAWCRSYVKEYAPVARRLRRAQEAA